MAIPNQQFPEFYRSHGIALLNSLADPEPSVIKHLPVSSILHQLGDDSSPNLDVSDPLMKGYPGRVPFLNVTKYDPDHVTGSVAAVDILGETNKFIRKNTQFKAVTDLKSLSSISQNQLIVANYGWLGRTRRPSVTAYNEFQRFENKLWAMIKNIKDLSLLTHRQHFVVLPTPEQLVGKAVLDNKSLAEVTVLARLFSTQGEQILRHVWLFLDKNKRSHSIFGSLSENNLKNLNLMFKVYDGRYVILNLGYLYSWIRGNPNLTPLSMTSTKDTETVQKYYLRSMMMLQTINEEGASAVSQAAALAEKSAMSDQSEDGVSAEEDGSVKDDTFREETEFPAVDLLKPGKNRQKSGSDNTGAPSQAELDKQLGIDLVQFERDIDADVAALDMITEKRLSKLANALVRMTGNDDGEQKTSYQPEAPETVEQIKASLFRNPKPEEALVEKLTQLAEDGRLSGADFRKKMQLAKMSSKNKDPYGSKKTIEEASLVTEKDLEIPKDKTVIEVPDAVIQKSMGECSMNYAAAKYNSDLIYRDMLSCVQAIQKGGVIVKNHRVERSTSILGTFDTHSLELIPLTGQPSIIYAKIPLVREDGVFTAKGNDYVMRKQPVSVPIRKINETRVAMNSYVGKTFVDRATKKANSYMAYVLSRFNKATIEPSESLGEVQPGNVFDNTIDAPYIYAGLAAHFKSFKSGGLNFQLDYKGFRTTLSPELREKYEVNGTVIAGYTDTKQLITVDKNNQFHVVGSQTSRSIGDIFDIIGLDRVHAPVDFAEVKIFSKYIPVGMALARAIGFKRLVKLLGASYRVVEGRKQRNLQPYEYVIQFDDVTYIFDRRQAKQTLILAGFRDYEKFIKLYPAEAFEQTDMYAKMLEAKGIGSIYLKQLDNLTEMFVDPITERELKAMGEPSSFNELLVRACEMLTDYHYPDPQDSRFQRIRGYERFPGFFYKNLFQAVCKQKSRNSTGRAKVEMPPYETWTTITRDASVKHAEDINPIQALKITQEAVTYVGEGGQPKETMNAASRAYTASNMGIMAGASVDSADVGINVFLSANPVFDSIGGTKKKGAKLTPANVVSTSELLSPFCSHDDQKRVAFIPIQQGHTIYTHGYEPPMVRTGYESVIGKRTGDMFARVAEAEGVVKSVSDKGIIVKYKDGTEKGYPLGTLYGKAEGSVYPHTLVTDLKKGDVVKKDDYITYNTRFFTKDPILPGGVVYKGSLMARVALLESQDVHEDSCVISEDLSRRFTTTITKVKKYNVSFKENIHDLVKIGQKLKPEDNMMIIEDEISTGQGDFSSASLSILANRAKNAPKSGYIASVSDIEVFYHGSKDDMSPSLRQIADDYDRRLAKTATDRNTEIVTGLVNGDFSDDGTPLAVNRAVIKVYLNIDDDAAGGDKVVWGLQLKSVIGEVMPYTLRTESGDIVDAKIGARSFAARIVRSLQMIGLRSSALDAVGKYAIKAYRAQ